MLRQLLRGLFLLAQRTVKGCKSNPKQSVVSAKMLMQRVLNVFSQNSNLTLSVERSKPKPVINAQGACYGQPGIHCLLERKAQSGGVTGATLACQASSTPAVFRGIGGRKKERGRIGCSTQYFPGGDDKSYSAAPSRKHQHIVTVNGNQY
ncbi:hypothetical protein E2C01_051918 [Portunus trituberculatus]|uniref:Uncharacterized protein n=1 Tax=Portunus trituberculatus TaxID=210409 RepID=A0A5B7GK55_PORTR|nr:hypothetical protein [Portunus trituberculatus]